MQFLRQFAVTAQLLSVGDRSPVRQPVEYRHPSSPPPEFPSKKQSCHFGSTLSPGMPVANERSSLSSPPVRSGSAESTRPSPSLSMPSEHCVLPTGIFGPVLAPPVSVVPPPSSEAPLAPPALPP